MFSGSYGTVRRLMRQVGWTCTFAFVVLLFQSVLWSDRVPIALKGLVVLMFAASAVSPASALVALAALVPFGHAFVTRVWQTYPLALSEALVLAFLAGYLWSRRREWFQPSAPADHLVLAVRLFALIVLASAAVQLAVVQLWTDVPSRYAVSFLNYLFREYLTTVPDIRPYANGRAFISIGALLVEGIALLLATRNLGGAGALGALKAITVGGLCAAVWGFYESLAWALGMDSDLWGLIRGNRWGTPMVPSVNTAGAYFVLVAFVAAAVAMSSRRWAIPGLLIMTLDIIALWLTQTRSAIVAGLASGGGSFVWSVASAFGWSRKQAVISAAAVALIGAVSLVIYRPASLVGGRGLESFRDRGELASVALHMIASRPVTGVGLGQYRVQYPQFASPEAVADSPRNDAHNYLLWLTAELGLFAVAIFVCLIAIAVTPGWRYAIVNPNDYTFVCVMAGLSAFLTTCSIGQPLSIPQVAYTFWIIVGIVTVWPRYHFVNQRRTSVSPYVLKLAHGAIILIVVSVPFRVQRAISEIDLTYVKYGFHDVSRVNNRTFTWAGPHVRFHLKSTVRAVTVPLAVRHPDTPHGANIDIFVDGKRVQSLTLTDPEFHEIRVHAPNSGAALWRVDLHVDPIGIDPDSDALRRIAVGDITAVAGAIPVQRPSSDGR